MKIKHLITIIVLGSILTSCMASSKNNSHHKTWWNVFYHYKHELVFEVREKDGHGIRWSQDGTRLIGFLETFTNE